MRAVGVNNIDCPKIAHMRLSGHQQAPEIMVVAGKSKCVILISKRILGVQIYTAGTKGGA